MHTKRLLLHELDDKHLTYLQKAVEWSIDTEISVWLRDIRDGTLAVFSLDGHGIIGLRRRADCIFIELLAGDNIRPYGREIVEWIKSFGKPIELCTQRPGLVRHYRTLGFEPTAVYMRLENGRE